ncbi:16S rRNA (guanine(966)-N(2))-methyltransferase RsmD [Cyanobium sp. Morenito 9A2]|uniref:16S rRNA (guanine(966)-N(2))-methyltransferase RsmD n=1 Tax=Cyanobium sp. Morenito 9A2 TaxID=2823718 RepID=UPI0020CDF6B3|nr:16S rRNA (guanine(966)-N(2))-methyltransferase RsmD [Cyanobium sp. Morenito 9A2]MCP9850729.1 16S rRNA (guanine(966)-N(2))-methyltransferase RsmD [Cyanobium sp. Morenito 9A2]
MSLRLSGGRKLISPPGEIARPTTARVRLAVMNLLAPDLAGCRWLDLFCGSGVMGCEALQRGAAAVVAVERHHRVAAAARRNLEAVALGLAGSGKRPSTQLEAREVLGWLESAPVTAFDLIYADPPYGAGLHGPVAERIAQRGWLTPEGRMVWECSSTAIPDVPDGWALRGQRRYGSTSLLILSR